MSPLAWKPNAGMNEDINAFVSDAFHRKSSKYQPGKTWQHNNAFEFLGASAEGVDDMFRPAGNILALDLETTGVEKGSDIIQFYAKAYDKDFKELDSGLEVIGKPKASTTWEPMAQDLAEKAGLTDDVLSKGLSPEELKVKLQSHLDYLVSKHGKFHALGSNVRFDLEKLSEILGEEQMAKYFHDEVLDTMSLSAYTTGRSGKSHLTHGLGAITQRLGITNTLAHNAKYDTEAAVAAYQGMLHVMSNTKPVSVVKSVSKAVPVRKVIKPTGWKFAAFAAVGLGVIGMASRGESEKEPEVSPKRIESHTPQNPVFNEITSLFEPERARVPEYNTFQEGIRRSYPTNYGQFEGIRPHPEAGFPGGRTQSFGALPRLKPPINHGYRNQYRHRVGYQPKAHASHPIRSRAERSHV